MEGLRHRLCYCPCFGFARNQVSPDGASSQVSESKVENTVVTANGVQQQGIVKTMAQKLPYLLRKLVLQDFSGWTPTPSIYGALLFFFLGGCLLLTLGILAVYAAMDVQEVRVRYDNIGQPGGEPGFLGADEAEQVLRGTNGTGYWVDLNISITKEMKAPVYLFYYITEFYGAHRRYIRSRSSEMLSGAQDPLSGDDKCRPKLYHTADGSPDPSLPQDGLVNPCGLLAWSYFNDTFQLRNSADGSEVTVNETGIAWADDAKWLYSDTEGLNFNSEERPWLRGGSNLTGPMNEDEHFMVWMRPTASPDVHHLWGIIDRDLLPGDRLTLSVHNRYNTYTWGGEKGIVLTTNTWIGGRNPFIGIYMLVLGTLYLVACLVMFATYLSTPRIKKAANLEFSWQRG
mmetsp:Transcript_15243/g.42654  ORF Transcript_15243/g.42654 Transcript_15243/m.42654 type:complete len:400 (+) Transcript_15243:317-1516(+)